VLSDVYLTEGKALSRLAVKGLEVGKEVVLKLAGTVQDVQETTRVLLRRKEEYDRFQNQRREEGVLADTVLRGLQRPTASRIEECYPDKSTLASTRSGVANPSVYTP
jgi:hypothetical protein